jgi:hypothetical protein
MLFSKARVSRLIKQISRLGPRSNGKCRSSPKQRSVAIPKVFVFTVLLSATVWSGKVYRAYRHNAVVNRHRQNALATFQAFAKAANDDTTKNAVLLQGTQCIFSPQQTGYIQSEADSPAPTLFEIIRGAGKSG